MATATASPLATAPAPAPRRPRVLLVGATFGAVASALTVMGLLAVYLGVRHADHLAGSPTFPKGTVIPLTPGTMALVTLGMSVVFMAWAVDALRHDDRGHAYVALVLTLVFGACFIIDTAYLYQQIAVAPTSAPIIGLLYAVTGAHIVMVVIGLLFVAVMGFQALGGQLTGRDAEGMSAAALYWYVDGRGVHGRLVRRLHHQVVVPPSHESRLLRCSPPDQSGSSGSGSSPWCSRPPTAGRRVATGSGPITVGWKGSVGDHIGYSLLIAVGAGALLLGLLALAIRDADSSALAQLAGTERPRPSRPPPTSPTGRSSPRSASPWSPSGWSSATSCSSPGSSSCSPSAWSGWSSPGRTGPPVTRPSTASSATA